MVDTGFLLDYSHIFKGKPIKISGYLKNIGLDTIIQFSSHFLTIQERGYGLDITLELINNWFSEENTSIKQYIVRKIGAFDPKLKKNITILNPISLLNLFEYSFENCKSPTTVSNKTIEIRLFKCLLSLNDSFNQRDMLVIESTKTLNPKYMLPAKFATSSIATFDFISFKINELIITQVMKASLLFQFFDSDGLKTKSVLAEFVKKYDSTNWKEFLLKYFPLLHGILRKANEGYLDFVVKNDNNYKESCDFLDSIMLNNVVELDDLDFKSVRCSPFYKIEEGTYRLLSIVLSIEKVYEGLYFDFTKINQSLKSQNKIYIEENFRGFYCLKFSEEFLVYKILSLSIPKKHIKISGVDLKAKGLTGEPDYYWRNGNKIFLFESKDVLINAEIKHSADFVRIEKALKDKFYYYTDNGQPHYLGIMQLLNNIKSILTGRYTFDTFNRGTIRIYPILITHHNIFNTPGLNQLINSWFKTELETISSSGLNTLNVNDLVIIDINTFILYHEQFRSRTLILEKLIEDYISVTNCQLDKLTGKPVNQRALDSLVSFSTYTSQIVDIRRLWKVPQLFTDLGLNLFKRN